MIPVILSTTLFTPSLALPPILEEGTVILRIGWKERGALSYRQLLKLIIKVLKASLVKTHRPLVLLAQFWHKM